MFGTLQVIIGSFLLSLSIGGFLDSMMTPDGLIGRMTPSKSYVLLLLYCNFVNLLLLCCISYLSVHSFFAVGSRDMSCRVFSLKIIDGFHYVTLSGHRSTVLACFFEHQSLDVSL